MTKITNLFTPVKSATTTSSSKIAKERLSVILASQRGSELLDGVDMTRLQQDVLSVVQRHIRAVAQDRPVQFQVKKDGEVDLFEMQVELDVRGGAGVGGRTVEVGVSTK